MWRRNGKAGGAQEIVVTAEVRGRRGRSPPLPCGRHRLPLAPPAAGAPQPLSAPALAARCCTAISWAPQSQSVPTVLQDPADLDQVKRTIEIFQAAGEHKLFRPLRQLSDVQLAIEIGPYRGDYEV